MEAIAFGAVVGAGVVLAWTRGKAGAKHAVSFVARQPGIIRGQIDEAIDRGRATAREHYQRDREERLGTLVDVPPPSSNGHPDGTSSPLHTTPPT